MVPGEKLYWSKEEEEQDIEQFRDALKKFRAQLENLEAACIDDTILRDAVFIAVDGYCRQLEAIERACQNARKDGAAARRS